MILVRLSTASRSFAGSSFVGWSFDFIAAVRFRFLQQESISVHDGEVAHHWVIADIDHAVGRHLPMLDDFETFDM
eukprot:m.256649 g.256649  ORF g.256649 m.256649 type:complete len:75 (+) comp54559_c0_seq11:3-227(+)